MESQNFVKVWDLFVRIFHWSLVFLFVVAYVTGEENESLHVWAGYIILALIGARIIWGFIGSRYARFSNFIRPPSEAIRYLKNLTTGQAPRSLGHNPAGGWMAIMLLTSILITGISGLLVLGTEGEGPLESYVSESAWIASLSKTYAMHEEQEDDDDHEYGEHDRDDHEEDEKMEAAEELLEEVHEFFANLTVLLVLLHITGVILSSRAHNENLAKSMVTGIKRTE